MAALIRFTLIGLYLALVLPLPFLAPEPLRPPLLLALPRGLLLVVAEGLLCYLEQVGWQC